MLLNLGNFREEYDRGELLESQVAADPFRQFELWFDTALKAGIPEPNAMVLATATPEGFPSARVVLLKEVESESFVFYTNYHSRKGRELAANPQAALVFNWLMLHRQVRIEGRVEKVPESMSAEYFQSRPRGSQIGAWASPQSEPIPNREVLEEKVRTLEEQYEDSEFLPRPPHWGGYRLIPGLVEFWQGRTSRLHDRLVYTPDQEGQWILERLAP